MTVPGLDPSDYFDTETFAAERRLFERSWQLVGLCSDLAQHQDFITATLAGRSVVIQNFEGALKGFHNVCSHRHARIRSTACGNGLLRCPYHGWTYNGEGVPVGIPGNAEFFGLDRAARKELALAPIAVECLGNLVFARLEPTGESVGDWLGAYAEPLEHLGSLFTQPFDRQSVDWAVNWKIGIESAIEGYHLDLIHPESFRPLTAGALPAEFAGPHSYGPTELSAEGRQSIERMGAKLGLARTERYTRYDHFFLFPNMMAIASAGTILSLQIYEPTGPETTRLRFWMLTGTSSKPAQRQGVAGRAIEGSLKEFNDRVLAEDQAISESVQRGKHLAARAAVLGSNEDRISAFHAAWRNSVFNAN